MAKYEEVELLVRIGEYKQGSDKLADEAVAKQEELVSFLKQPTDERSDFVRTIKALEALVR
jgi:type III secretion protein N (ATPase)